MIDMPIGRITDLCSGHKCYPPSIAIEGSSNTLVNDLPIHRLGDAYMPHCCKSKHPNCHIPRTIFGSPSVYVNDLPSSHVGSLTDCSKANIMMTGSFDTWIEGF